MRILFLGDVVGNTGCSKIFNNLLSQKKLSLNLKKHIFDLILTYQKIK